MLRSLLFTILIPSLTASGREPLFDMEAIRDATTLQPVVLQDWQEVPGPTPSRQKLLTIRVGEMWPGQELRMPVRLVVPVSGKARGFHLTGSSTPERIQQDYRLSAVEAQMLEEGIGQVQTVVQTLQTSGLGDLAKESERRFLASLHPRLKVQYWAWPATLMRAITAAHAETEHVVPGKVAMSGGSKNGASPSMALLHDERMTAVFASISPIWDSPLRLCDRAAWDQRESRHGPLRHPFLGGHFGPSFHREALAAGRSWEDLQQFTADWSDDVFISRHYERLVDRGVDMLFHPGSHDFVAFDLAWGGAHHPEIPIYLAANTGHGHKNRHPGTLPGNQNRDIFLLHHFFEEVPDLLSPPRVESERQGQALRVRVTFPPQSGEQSGRIYWMFDRPDDGSPGYIRELFPEDQWSKMERTTEGVWEALLPLRESAERIDFFSTHRKEIEYGGRRFSHDLSSPYTRVSLSPTDRE